jgi:hypothetical protein
VYRGPDETVTARESAGREKARGTVTVITQWRGQWPPKAMSHSVEFQSSEGAVLGCKAHIPHRAVTLTLTLSPWGGHTLFPRPLVAVRKESASVRIIWVLRGRDLLPHMATKEAQRG